MKTAISLPLPVWMAADAAAGADTGDKGGGDAAAIAANAAAAADKGGDKSAPAAKGGVPTALDDTGGDDDVKVVAPANWPEAWKDMLAGEDKDSKTILERMKSPGDLLKSYREAKAFISKGLKGPEMPDPENAEAMKAWRKEMQIPDDPTGYAIPDTVKDLITPEDKPIISAFTEEMHKRNWSQKQVADGLEWYYDFQAGVEGQQLERDKTNKSATEETLRAEWGKEFKALRQAAGDFGKEIFGADVPWANARLPNDPALGEMAGRRLGDIPDFMKRLADAAILVKGDVTFVNPEGANKTMDRIKELEAKMGTNEFSPAERNELISLKEKASKAAAKR